MINPDFHLHILGGGISGLASGYFAKKRNLPFSIIEARDRIGGNATTLRFGEHLYDSGAHRLHDKDPDTTREIQYLLGNSLRKISAPSQIFENGRWIDFPLSTLNLFRNLGPRDFLQTGLELISGTGKPSGNLSFEDFAVRKYGRSLSERFLLNYSSKLWGRPCNELSPNISGKRLEGLNLKTFLLGSLPAKWAGSRHLDGAFFYPDHGIGMITGSLAEYCGADNIQTRASVTRITHNGQRIEGIEINNESTFPVDQLLSTLPLDVFLRLMDPQPPEDILHLAACLTYRHVILTIFKVHKERIGNNASVYFPDGNFPFTRVYEPKQRSSHMSPRESTSLVAELTCNSEDPLWTMSDKGLRQLVEPHLLSVGWLRPEELGNMQSYRMPYAYPVQNLGIESIVKQLHAFCNSFSNLKITGRNGLFAYIHMHDLIRISRSIISDYASRPRNMGRTSCIST